MNLPIEQLFNGQHAQDGGELDSKSWKDIHERHKKMSTMIIKSKDDEIKSLKVKIGKLRMISKCGYNKHMRCDGCIRISVWDKLGERADMLDNILAECEHVDRPNRRNRLIIMRCYKVKDNQCALYIIRAQKESMVDAIDRVKKKYKNNDIRRWLVIDHPNAKELWNKIRSTYNGNGLCFPENGHFFDVQDLTYDMFELMVKYIKMPVSSIG